MNEQNERRAIVSAAEPYRGEPGYLRRGDTVVCDAWDEPHEVHAECGAPVLVTVSAEGYYRWPRRSHQYLMAREVTA